MSFTIRPAEGRDAAAWLELDRHLSEAGFLDKVRAGQALVITEGETVAGVLRWNLFWDLVPFCTLLYIAAPYRGQGCGRRLMAHWEAAMGAKGYETVMTSTQANENAQHFYRKLGYRDSGGFVPGPGEPLELILIKEIGNRCCD